MDSRAADGGVAADERVARPACRWRCCGASCSLLLFAVVQTALVFYAGQLAATAAQEGCALRAHRPAAGWSARTRARRRSSSPCAAGTALADTVVTAAVDGPTGVVQVRVTGTAPSLVPGIDDGHPQRRRRRGTDHPMTPTPARRGCRAVSGAAASSVEAALIAVVVGLVLAFALAAAGSRWPSRRRHRRSDPPPGRRPSNAHITAQVAARRGAGIGLSEQGLQCAALDAIVDTTDFALPLGTPGSVTASVRCAVLWSDLGTPRAPGTYQVPAVRQPIDQRRERT